MQRVRETIPLPSHKHLFVLTASLLHCGQIVFTTQNMSLRVESLHSHDRSDGPLLPPATAHQPDSTPVRCGLEDSRVARRRSGSSCVQCGGRCCGVAGFGRPRSDLNCDRSVEASRHSCSPCSSRGIETARQVPTMHVVKIAHVLPPSAFTSILPLWLYRGAALQWGEVVSAPATADFLGGSPGGVRAALFVHPTNFKTIWIYGKLEGVAKAAQIPSTVVTRNAAPHPSALVGALTIVCSFVPSPRLLDRVRHRRLSNAALEGAWPLDHLAPRDEEVEHSCQHKVALSMAPKWPRQTRP